MPRAARGWAPPTDSKNRCSSSIFRDAIEFTSHFLCYSVPEGEPSSSEGKKDDRFGGKIAYHLITPYELLE